MEFYSRFHGEICSFKCSVFQVRVQMHWESSGRYSESFQGLLFSPFFSGIFTSSSAAPRAIHYCVKVLVLCFGLEAQ